MKDKKPFKPELWMFIFVLFFVGSVPAMVLIKERIPFIYGILADISFVILLAVTAILTFVLAITYMMKKL